GEWRPGDRGGTGGDPGSRVTVPILRQLEERPPELMIVLLPSLCGPCSRRSGRRWRSKRGHRVVMGWRAVQLVAWEAWSRADPAAAGRGGPLLGRAVIAGPLVVLRSASQRGSAMH